MGFLGSQLFTVLEHVPPDNIPAVFEKDLLSYAINPTSIWKSFFFFFGWSFFCCFEFSFFFFIAKRTTVLYNLNMVHLICKAYSKYNWNHRNKKFGTCYHCWWYWGTLSFQPDFILCSVFTLKLFVLNWTWSWPTAYVDIIYYDYTHTHTLCSEQSHSKTNQLMFLPPDEFWWLNFTDDQRSLTNIYEFLLDLQTLLLFFSYGDATLFSAVVCIILFTQPFCLEKNKTYYIHIWIWCFSFYCGLPKRNECGRIFYITWDKEYTALFN